MTNTKQDTDTKEKPIYGRHTVPEQGQCLSSTTQVALKNFVLSLVAFKSMQNAHGDCSMTRGAPLGSLIDARIEFEIQLMAQFDAIGSNSFFDNVFTEPKVDTPT